MADDLVVDWPDRLLADIGGDLGPRDAVCILTHDAKFDVPAVTASLETKVGYIGVMGSRRTHDDRTKRLVDAGVDQTGLDRLRSPIGLISGPARPRRQRSHRGGDHRGAHRPLCCLLSRTEGPIHD